jgi:hypothetical protein
MKSPGNHNGVAVASRERCRLGFENRKKELANRILGEVEHVK